MGAGTLRRRPREIVIEQGLDEVPPKRIFRIKYYFILSALIVAFLVQNSDGYAHAEIAKVQVEVRKGERNSELKASLRAKRKIYLDLATQHIRLPRNTRPAIRNILKASYF